MHTPPILLPDVTAFDELLEYVSEWDHETMSHKAGVLPPDSPRPAPRYIGQERTVAGLAAAVGFRTAPAPGNEIGPFCTVDLSQLDGPAHRSIAVRATDAVMAAVEGRIVTDDDHLSFRIIGHKHTGTALVILQHGHISGSHWLAHIDPATIPAYPYTARDERISEVCAAIRDSGTHGEHVPFRRNLPGGAVEITHRSAGIKATIQPDGSTDRTWADGTLSHEPAR